MPHRNLINGCVLGVDILKDLDVQALHSPMVKREEPRPLPHPPLLQPYQIVEDDCVSHWSQDSGLRSVKSKNASGDLSWVWYGTILYSEVLPGLVEE